MVPLATLLNQVALLGVKIILLHELKNDEGIRLFLQDTWETYVKVCLSPSRFPPKLPFAFDTLTLSMSCRPS